MDIAVRFACFICGDHIFLENNIANHRLQYVTGGQST